VGQTKTVTCTLTNGGPQSVTVSKAAVSSSAYTIASPAFPLVLASGKSAVVTIRFAPKAAQWFWGTVAFASNASDPTVSVQLNGGGVIAKGSGGSSGGGSGSTTGSSGGSTGGGTTPGVLAASRTSVSFGTVSAGGSSTLAETLTNTGKSAVTISSASASGTGFSDSGITLPLTLAASHSVTFNVVFAPKTAGADTGSLTIVSNAATKTLTIPLSGSTAVAGALAVTPATASLGSVAVGSSKTMAATLAASTASVVVTGVTTTSSEFSVSGMTFPVTIASGKAAAFTVKFTPNSSGAATGKLSFVANASNSPAVESVTGTGTGAAAQHTVSLSWKASSSAVSGYDIYRGTTSGGPYSRVNGSTNTGTTYSDTTVVANETYYYVVTGVNSSGSQSNYSNQVTAAVP
jgi:hypothetical protein